VRSDSVEVLLPQVSDHEYLVGTLDLQRSAPFESLLPLKVLTQESYRLASVAGRETDPPQFDPEVNGVISGVHTINRDPKILRCSFSLPVPDAILAMRQVPEFGCAGGFFAGRDVGLLVQKPHALSLVQVLVYRRFVYDNLRLEPSVGWRPQLNSTNAVNLHLFAEPRVEIRQEEHSSNAFDRLIALFPEIQDLHLACPLGEPSREQTGLPPWA
jgi:hypothetical protein